MWLPSHTDVADILMWALNDRPHFLTLLTVRVGSTDRGAFLKWFCGATGCGDWCIRDVTVGLQYVVSWECRKGGMGAVSRHSQRGGQLTDQWDERLLSGGRL